ncbi:MAG TPA: flippase [Terriglobia bacterium]|nr:flippase [Terriglobia bacterium]
MKRLDPTPIGRIDIIGLQVARNTAFNVVGRIAPLLVAVVAMPYVIRHLGPDRFGLLALAWIVVGYFALFDLGIGPATTKFVAELLGKGEIEKLPELVWTALASQTCFGVLAGVLVAAASPLLVDRLLKIPVEIHPQARWVFLILAAALPLDFATGSLRGVLAASQRFDLLNAVGIPSSALNYLLPVVALALGFGLPAIVLFLVLGRAASLAALAVLCVRLYPSLGARACFNRRLVRPLLTYGGWVTVSGAVGPILAFFDRFLIGMLISIAAVGYYTPPYVISNKLGLLPASLAAALFPAFSTSAARGDAEWIRNALVRSLKFLLLLVGPVALMLVFFAGPFLIVWLGARFAAEGTLVLQIMVAAMFVNSLAFVPYHLLYALGRPDLPAKFHLLELPLCVGLDWLLITRFGLTGAAFAWAVVNSLDFILLITAACWLTRTSPRLLAGRDVRRSVVSLLALAAGLTVLWVSTHTLITGVVFTLLLSGGFLLAAWHYVLDLEEKWQIRLWLKVARQSSVLVSAGEQQ